MSVGGTVYRLFASISGRLCTSSIIQIILITRFPMSDPKSIPTQSFIASCLDINNLIEPPFTVRKKESEKKRKKIIHLSITNQRFPAGAKISCQISSHCCCLYERGLCGLRNVLARSSRRRLLRIFSASRDFQSRRAKRILFESIAMTPEYTCKIIQLLERVLKKRVLCGGYFGIIDIGSRGMG